MVSFFLVKCISIRAEIQHLFPEKGWKIIPFSVSGSWNWKIKYREKAEFLLQNIVSTLYTYKYQWDKVVVHVQLCVFILLRLYNIDHITYCKHSVSSWVYSYVVAHYIIKSKISKFVISSILLKYCAMFGQISSKMFVIPRISSILINFQRRKRPCI